MSDLLAGLNPEQRQAVETINGAVLVLAGPGSGKTRVLTHRIAYMIEQGIQPWRILAVTFTNKAAKEMRHRLNQLIEEAAEAQAVTMGTFHAICSRILRRYIDLLGYEKSFLIYSTGDQRTLIKQILFEMNLDQKRYRPAGVHGTISRAKNDDITPKTFRAKDYYEEIVGRIYEQYQEKLKSNNALDFDDLLVLTLRLFREQPEVLERYRRTWQYILIDEFQDTNLVQYELVRLLSETNKNIFVVGDLDQSIYGWRGADYRNILKFEQRFPKRKIIALEQNYRSTQMILTAASALIRRNSNRKDKGLWSNLGQGHPIKVFEAYDEREEAQYIVREIKRLKHGDGYSNRDMAIMYRTNAQSRGLEEALMRSKLKYIIVRGTPFYERREVKDILAYLRLLHNPADTVSLERIINVPKRSIGKTTYQQLLQWAALLSVVPFMALKLLNDHHGPLSPLPPGKYPPFSPRSSSSLLAFYRLVAPLREKLEELNLSELIGELLKAIDYGKHIRDGSKESQERWENVLELYNVTAQYEHLKANEGLAEFLQNITLESSADNMPEEEADFITLMTLHTAKGLEYPVVFMPGMNEDVLPHFRSKDNAKELEEERRLAYVGITRAKQRLYLIYTFRRRIGWNTVVAAPSIFLRELPRESLELSKESSRRPGGKQATQRVIKPKSNPNRTAKRRKGERAKRRSTASSPTRRPKQRKPTKEKTVQAQFKRGERVRHSRFGDGVVISSQLERDDERVEVLFAGQKRNKMLMASFAKLEKL